MNKKELDEIRNKENPDIKDVVYLLSEFFLSQTKHFSDIKQSLSHIEVCLVDIVERLEKSSSSVFQILEEDDED